MSMTTTMSAALIALRDRDRGHAIHHKTREGMIARGWAEPAKNGLKLTAEGRKVAKTL